MMTYPSHIVDCIKYYTCMIAISSPCIYITKVILEISLIVMGNLKYFIWNINAIVFYVNSFPVHAWSHLVCWLYTDDERWTSWVHAHVANDSWWSWSTERVKQLCFVSWKSIWQKISCWITAIGDSKHCVANAYMNFKSRCMLQCMLGGGWASWHGT